MPENPTTPADETPETVTVPEGNPEAGDTQEGTPSSEEVVETKPSAIERINKHRGIISAGVASVLTAVAMSQCSVPDSSRSTFVDLAPNERIASSAAVDALVRFGQIDDTGRLVATFHPDNNHNDVLSVRLSNGNVVDAVVEGLSARMIGPEEMAISMTLEYTDSDDEKHTIEVADDVSLESIDTAYQEYRLTGAITPDQPVTFTYRHDPEEIRTQADRHPLGQ